MNKALRLIIIGAACWLAVAFSMLLVVMLRLQR